MKTATLIKNLPTSASGATQALYLMTPPIKEEGYSEDDATLWNYVVVSAVRAFDTGRNETYIFPANEKGDIVSWGELDGSMRGTRSHAEALANAGYTIAQLSIG